MNDRLKTAEDEIAYLIVSQNGARAVLASQAIWEGIVWINSHLRSFAETELWAYERSCLGRLHGLEALHDFLKNKHIYMEAGVTPQAVQ